MLAATISITTSPGPAVGSGRSPYFKTSGPPCRSMKAAFICSLTSATRSGVSIAQWSAHRMLRQGTSLRLEPELFDHRAPTIDLAADEIAQLLGRRAQELDRGQPLAELGQRHDPPHLGVELGNDRFGCARGCEQSVPLRRDEIEPLLAERGNIGYRGITPGGSDPERAHEPGLVLRQRLRHGGEGHWNLPGQNIVESGHAAAIDNMIHIDAGLKLEHLSHEMRHAAGTGGAEI